jgi:hypothetical protein
VAGIVAPHVDLEPGLGVAVERYPARRAEHLLAARPRVIRKSDSLRHGFS